LRFKLGRSGDHENKGQTNAHTKKKTKKTKFRVCALSLGGQGIMRIKDKLMHTINDRINDKIKDIIQDKINDKIGIKDKIKDKMGIKDKITDQKETFLQDTGRCCQGLPG